MKQETSKNISFVVIKKYIFRSFRWIELVSWVLGIVVKAFGG